MTQITAATHYGVVRTCRLDGTIMLCTVVWDRPIVDPADDDSAFVEFRNERPPLRSISPALSPATLPLYGYPVKT